MLRCVFFMTRPAVLKPHLERQPQQPQPHGQGSDAPPGDPDGTASSLPEESGLVRPGLPPC